MSEHRWVRRVTAGVLLATLAAVPLTGCGDDAQVVGDAPSSAGESAGVPSAAPAPPFTVSPVPEGRAVTAVVDGTAPQRFSDDTGGGVHPKLILVPTDWAGLADHRWIEVASIDGSGNQGGIYQELPGYLFLQRNEGRTEVNGKAAFRRDSAAPEDGTERSAAFVVVSHSVPAGGDIDSGDQRGLLVTGPVDDLDLLTMVAESAGSADDRTPTLDRVPEGWRLLGVLSSSSAFGPDEMAIDYLPRGRRGVFLGNPFTDGLAVQAFPGGAEVAELKAIEQMWNAYDRDNFDAVGTIDVGGAPAYLVTCCDADPAPGPQSATAWFSVDGHAFMVSGGGAAQAVGTPEALAAFVTTIRITTEEDWAAAKLGTPSSMPAPAPVEPTMTTLPVPAGTPS